MPGFSVGPQGKYLLKGLFISSCSFRMSRILITFLAFIRKGVFFALGILERIKGRIPGYVYGGLLS